MQWVTAVACWMKWHFLLSMNTFSKTLKHTPKVIIAKEIIHTHTYNFFGYSWSAVSMPSCEKSSLCSAGNSVSGCWDLNAASSALCCMLISCSVASWSVIRCRTSAADDVIDGYDWTSWCHRAASITSLSRWITDTSFIPGRSVCKHTLIFIITSAKEVMFLPVFVCLSVCVCVC